MLVEKVLCAYSLPLNTQEPEKTCQSFFGSGCRPDDYCVSQALCSPISSTKSSEGITRSWIMHELPRSLSRSRNNCEIFEKNDSPGP